MNRLLNKVLVSVVIASQFATIPPLTEVAKASTKSSDGLVDNTSNVSVVSQVDGGTNSKEEYILGGTVKNQVYLAKKATKATKTKIPVYKVSKVDTKTVNRVHNNLLAHKRFKLQIKASSKKNAQKYMTTLQKKVAEKNEYGILFSCLGYEDGGRAVDQLKMTKVKYVKSGKYYTVEFYAENGKFYDYAIQTVNKMWDYSLHGDSSRNYESNGIGVSNQFSEYSDEQCDASISNIGVSLYDASLQEIWSLDNIVKYGNPSTFRLSDLYKRFRTGVGGYMEAEGGYHSTLGCTCKEQDIVSGGAVVGTKTVWTHSEECDKFCRGHFGTTCKYLDKYTDEQIDSIATMSRAGKNVVLWSGDMVKAQKGIDIPVVGQGTYIWEHHNTLNLYEGGCDTGCQSGVHSDSCISRQKEILGRTFDDFKAMSYEDVSSLSYNKYLNYYNYRLELKERCRRYVSYVYNTPFYKLDGYTKIAWLPVMDFVKYNSKTKQKEWYFYDMDNHASDLFKVWKSEKIEGVCGDLASCCVMLMKVTGIDKNAYLDVNWEKDHGVAVFTVTQPYYEGFMPAGDYRYCGSDESYVDEYGEQWETYNGLDTRKGKKVKYCYTNGWGGFYGNYDFFWDTLYSS